MVCRVHQVEFRWMTNLHFCVGVLYYASLSIASWITLIIDVCSGTFWLMDNRLYGVAFIEQVPGSTVKVRKHPKVA